MRIKNTMINIFAGIGNQLIITALSFISRSVFIATLGIEYLGVNGLFTSILAMLSLAEAGIGASIIYNLYKPVAENDQEQINVLMKLYRKAYLVIALVVGLLGLSFMPFLGFFVKDAQVDHLYLIFGIFLINTVAPYLFQSKLSFLNVNQKSYVVTAAYSVSSILSTSLKIAILYYTHNYILFLVVDCLLTLSTSLFLSRMVDRKYPFLKNPVTGKLDPDTRHSIIRNVKAIVLQNIGGYFVFGADSLIISSFVSLAAVGLYSNYKMLIDISRTFVNQVFNNMYHSVGNLVAKESTDKVYSVYNATMLVNFWLYSLFAILLYVLIDPFITVWIGPKFLMGHGALVLMLLVFFERGMRNSISTVKTTAGIFHEDRFAPLIQAGVNLAAALVLVQWMGIAGVFLGSLIGSLAVPFWYTPHLVYKKVFLRPVRHYYLRYLRYSAVGVAALAVVYFLADVLPSESWLHVIVKAIVCFAAVNLIYLSAFYRSQEFKYLLGVGKNLLAKLPIRRRIEQIERLEGIR
ncbi:lipopolysaccharide biosynthesis protein [Gorillibacterium timonense]|uniref:lipopolysaccharide biosynthesis protein n=1 Tax=Gorillibacterium timonense TaxID=1689269 RepID=UPI00071CF8F7|nr:flippase [Gorillibacterium timonense]